MPTRCCGSCTCLAKRRGAKRSEAAGDAQQFRSACCVAMPGCKDGRLRRRLPNVKGAHRITTAVQKGLHKLGSDTRRPRGRSNGECEASSGCWVCFSSQQVCDGTMISGVGCCYQWPSQGLVCVFAILQVRIDQQISQWCALGVFEQTFPQCGANCAIINGCSGLKQCDTTCAGCGEASRAGSGSEERTERLQERRVFGNRCRRHIGNHLGKGWPTRQGCCHILIGNVQQTQTHQVSGTRARRPSLQEHSQNSGGSETTSPFCSTCENVGGFLVVSRTT
mmetsp:Transcript_169729/g.544709  ORF Transcript_169729/g.544709 Transcript_169729/m.544709 type:complete len:279 (+) Transcript_169729:1092-1928(+)